MKTWVRQRITGIVHESHYSAEFLALLLSLLYEPNGLAMAGQNRLKALLQVLWLEQTTISIKPWISNGLLNALNKSSKKLNRPIPLL
ncbi:MAG: hypothetical protein HWD59_08160 [Coxiellaceae bacterium]|nr:MAG: hypothetical protein HWD59_08160 [Coxiellaceae bacterium]